jgi:hypothetical protein
MVPERIQLGVLDYVLCMYYKATRYAWACLWIRHELLRPVPPWFLQQLGRPVGNPPYHPDGPPWLDGLGLRRWYTYLVYPQQ